MRITKKGEENLRLYIYISALITLGIVLWILGHILINGIIKVDWKVALEDKAILPSLINTFYIVLLSVLITAPIGIGAAIYLNEYAKEGKFVSLIRYSTQSLAGIPSIIFGLFGMIFFVTNLKLKWSILSGALTLSIMILPIIIRTTEEALKTVPITLKEGSLALGASKIETIYKVILPTALPGIMVSIILSVGRVIGETAAVYLTAGMVPRLASSIFDSGRTLSVHLYILAKEGISFELAYFTASILIIFILIINIISNCLGKIVNKKLKGN
ncbi:phosphate ABC transporter permease PstA [Tissierella sp. MSJ-40]|uniref:Phosphate transport system permease protein PstA n=1 Tax=Tissierella simiarum TaxID=2841534 RepID=A0ABS6E7G8_9FIRM|nr:phosphate ABC transporter permease PstA [Tissierella simiarum]MBU5438189.1 phosphate ABC transporter permease PstA [Tissierella simiarum]